MNMAADSRGDGSFALPAVPTGEVVLEVGGQPLRFHTTEDGRQWAAANDVAAFLGYSSRRQLLTLWTRHMDELEGETIAGLVVRTSTRWGAEVTQERAVRGFSPRGVKVLALASRTLRGVALRAALVDSQAAPAPVAITLPAASPRITQEEAVEALKGVLDEARDQVDSIRKALPKGSEARAVAIDVRDSLREAQAVLAVHAGAADLQAQGRAMSALLGRDVPSTKGDPANGWDRLLGITEGRRS